MQFSDFPMRPTILTNASTNRWRATSRSYADPSSGPTFGFVTRCGGVERTAGGYLLRTCDAPRTSSAP